MRAVYAEYLRVGTVGEIRGKKRTRDDDYNPKMYGYGKKLLVKW